MNSVLGTIFLCFSSRDRCQIYSPPVDITPCIYHCSVPPMSLGRHTRIYDSYVCHGTHCDVLQNMVTISLHSYGAYYKDFCISSAQFRNMATLWNLKSQADELQIRSLCSSLSSSKMFSIYSYQVVATVVDRSKYIYRQAKLLGNELKLRQYCIYVSIWWRHRENITAYTADEFPDGICCCCLSYGRYTLITWTMYDRKLLTIKVYAAASSTPLLSANTAVLRLFAGCLVLTARKHLEGSSCYL